MRSCVWIFVFPECIVYYWLKKFEKKLFVMATNVEHWHSNVS